jgi:hypothetical protein
MVFLIGSFPLIYHSACKVNRLFHYDRRIGLLGAENRLDFETKTQVNGDGKWEFYRDRSRKADGSRQSEFEKSISARRSLTAGRVGERIE